MLCLCLTINTIFPSQNLFLWSTKQPKNLLLDPIATKLEEWQGPPCLDLNLPYVFSSRSLTIKLQFPHQPTLIPYFCIIPKNCKPLSHFWYRKVSFHINSILCFNVMDTLHYKSIRGLFNAKYFSVFVSRSPPILTFISLPALRWCRMVWQLPPQPPPQLIANNSCVHSFTASQS